MDLRKVKKLIELLEASELVEMEITEGKSTIRLSRGTSAAQPPMAFYAGPQISTAAQPVTAQHLDKTPPETSTELSKTGEILGETINSPMVGTFYESSSPDSGPYVSVGSTVKPGDTLCIIEAMKTFNQLEAEVSGTIKAVYKSTGDPVEYGEPLFLIG